MKNTLFIVFLLILPFYLTAKNDQERKMIISAKGKNKLIIECGAGYLHIQGQPNIQEISVKAVLEPRTITWQDVKKHFTLKLESKGNQVILISQTKSMKGFWDWLFKIPDIQIHLTITVPQNMMLDINDGSGDIKISQISNTINITDGSGNIFLSDIAGDLNIDDGSGDLFAQNIEGDLNISDGSGTIEIFHQTGLVNIDDGSGKIVLKDLQGPLQIDDSSGDVEITEVMGNIKVDDSSGDITIRQVQGTVVVDDGSGDIKLQRIKGDVIIEEDGSGMVLTNDISGKIINKSED